MVLLLDLGEVAIGTTHLFWDPRVPDVKLLQAFAAASALRGFAGAKPCVRRSWERDFYMTMTSSGTHAIELYSDDSS